jgi:hypothetical protein
MHRRLGVLAGFQKIQRLKEHATEATKISHQLSQFRIITGRQVRGVLKGRIEVELKPDLDDSIGSILHVEGIVVKANLARGNHIAQSLFAVECTLEIKGNRHGWLLII